MRLSIKHATTYAYDPPAERCALRLRLYPPSFDSQRVISWKVSVNGQVMPALLSTATGAFMGRYPIILLAGEADPACPARHQRHAADGLGEISPGVYLESFREAKEESRKNHLRMKRLG